MFGRRRDRAATQQAGRPLSGYHAEVVLVADADVRNRARVARIFDESTAGLTGHIGTTIGYDRGDPTRSLTAPAGAQASPLAAQARLGSSGLIVPDHGEYADTPSINPDALTSPGYRATLARRRNR